MILYHIKDSVNKLFDGDCFLQHQYDYMNGMLMFYMETSLTKEKDVKHREIIEVREDFDSKLFDTVGEIFYGIKKDIRNYRNELWC